jgi:hypothetical protein
VLAQPAALVFETDEDQQDVSVGFADNAVVTDADPCADCSSANATQPRRPWHPASRRRHGSAGAPAGQVHLRRDRQTADFNSVGAAHGCEDDVGRFYMVSSWFLTRNAASKSEGGRSSEEPGR